MCFAEVPPVLAQNQKHRRRRPAVVSAAAITADSLIPGPASAVIEDGQIQQSSKVSSPNSKNISFLNTPKQNNAIVDVFSKAQMVKELLMNTLAGPNRHSIYSDR